MKTVRVSLRLARLEDFGVWPVPTSKLPLGADRLSWVLRHGTDEQVLEHKVVAAAYVEAFDRLVHASQRKRNELCAALLNVPNYEEPKE